MAYADFEYYKSTYGGMAITQQSDFDPMALRASVYLDYITMGKAKSAGDLDEVKLACCALAEQYRMLTDLYRAAAEGYTGECGAMQSQSVGSYSVTYRDPAQSARGSLETANTLTGGLYAIVQQYLAHTGLLYRGRGCGTCTLPTL